MDVFQLNKLTVFGSVQADDDSLLSHLSKFPPSLSFYHTYFLHDGYAVEFLRVNQFVLFWKKKDFYSILSILL